MAVKDKCQFVYKGVYSQDIRCGNNARENGYCKRHASKWAREPAIPHNMRRKRDSR